MMIGDELLTDLIDMIEIAGRKGNTVVVTSSDNDDNVQSQKQKLSQDPRSQRGVVRRKTIEFELVDGMLQPLFFTRELRQPRSRLPQLLHRQQPHQSQLLQSQSQNSQNISQPYEKMKKRRTFEFTMIDGELESLQSQQQQEDQEDQLHQQENQTGSTTRTSTSTSRRNSSNSISIEFTMKDSELESLQSKQQQDQQHQQENQTSSTTRTTTRRRSSNCNSIQFTLEESTHGRRGKKQFLFSFFRNKNSRNKNRNKKKNNSTNNHDSLTSNNSSNSGEYEWIRIV